MQVSRCVGLLHHQNLLDHAPQVPRDRLRPEGQVQQSGARGGGPRLAPAAAHLPQGEEGARLPEALRNGPGLHRALAQLLRRGRQNGQRGDAGAAVQPDVAAHRWL